VLGWGRRGILEIYLGGVKVMSQPCENPSISPLTFIKFSNSPARK